MDTKFKKGHPKLLNAGRRKGVKNKLPSSIKDNFIKVFEKLGGVEGFYDWAQSNKQTRERFYQMYSRLLPTNVTAELSGKSIVKIEFVPEKKKEKKEDDKAV